MSRFFTSMVCVYLLWLTVVVATNPCRSLTCFECIRSKGCIFYVDHEQNGQCTSKVEYEAENSVYNILTPRSCKRFIKYQEHFRTTLAPKINILRDNEQYTVPYPTTDAMTIREASTTAAIPEAPTTAVILEASTTAAAAIPEASTTAAAAFTEDSITAASAIPEDSTTAAIPETSTVAVIPEAIHTAEVIRSSTMNNVNQSTRLPEGKESTAATQNPTTVTIKNDEIEATTSAPVYRTTQFYSENTTPSPPKQKSNRNSCAPRNKMGRKNRRNGRNKDRKPIPKETKKQRAYRALCETYDFVVEFLGTENDEVLKKWNDQNPVKGNYHLCDYLKSRIEKF